MIRPRGRPLLFVLLVLLGACHDNPPVSPAQEEENLFHNVCARCHGPDGTGGPPDMLGNPGPKNFTEPAFQRSFTDAQMKNAIENGNRGMPAFGAVLTPAQIALMIGHIRKFGAEAQAASADAGVARSDGGAAK